MAILASIASEAKGDAERAVAISDLPEYLYKTERENKVFFTCSLIDYIARATKNRRSDGRGKRSVRSAWGASWSWPMCTIATTSTR